ncbi:SET domain-containing protein-lysine N-methyltransferase [Candidatus Parcubacteria bacterium]|nr:SET domain-containing protein-lysine N-methyltransferase [Candidatus Parcubacteria bacterium]
MAKQNKFTPGNFDLRVKKARAGFGLFAFDPIPKGACVIEYKGRVLTDDQDEKSNSMYLFLVSKKKTIDGWIPNNKAKYINHSCRPNCEIDIYKERVWVMAKRAIKEGEELSYDYDTEYFDEHIKPKGCKCLKCSPVKDIN